MTGIRQSANCFHRMPLPETRAARRSRTTIISASAEPVSYTHLAYEMEVTGENENWSVRFKNAIIAAGSSAAKLPGFPYGHPALVDSTGALDLKKIPEKMLVIGGGIIGLEMACVYDALGAKVTIAEFSDGLILSLIHI